MNSKKKTGNNFGLWIIIGFVFIYVLGNIISGISSFFNDDGGYVYSDKKFNLISSSENIIFDSEIKDFAKKNKIDINIEYDDTLKITKRLNAGEEFDAVWLSNSIWMYSLDSSKVKVTDTKSTSINPVVLAIRKSKAEELGFIGKDIYTQDIVNAASEGKLNFNISNPVTTNSGASAYLGILTSLAGNPEVLTTEMLNDQDLKEKLRNFFMGVERSVGDEDSLEEFFLNGNYEAVFTYESAIININKELKKNNKEILYALYPVDGVSISDSPIGYINHDNDKKKEEYDKLVEYLTGKDGQKLLAKYGRRTWFGGVTNKADKKVFNPDWGIDTTKYISPLKYPATSVIKEALFLYQSALRKPVHVVFCLDYSGSMSSYNRYNNLVDAMDYILTDRSAADLLQFSDDDIVEVIPFASNYDEVWKGSNEDLLLQIKRKSPNGGTALYPATKHALELLKDEDKTKYNTSVIVMTDGEGNVGYFRDLEKYYRENNLNIPIYSIKFGAADEKQLHDLQVLSNGKVFDGTTSLVDAFMEVRGYN